MKNQSTTSIEDQVAVQKLKERLELCSTCPSKQSSHNQIRIPFVSIDEGANKYVLISAMEPNSSLDTVVALDTKNHSYFVVSKRDAVYHRDAAEPLIDELEEFGYNQIRILGGGRILLDHNARKIFVFGYSYGFGRADHSKTADIIQSDLRYNNYKVTWSNAGY